VNTPNDDNDGYDNNGAVSCRDGPAGESPSFVAPGSLAARYLDCLLAGERTEAARLIDDAVASGVSVRDVYLTIIQPTQYEVGRLWELDRLSVAEEHFCTGVSQLVIARLYPRWLKAPVPGAPRAVITSVDCELHELGGRMVADFLEMDGWDTLYLGASFSPPAVAALLRERRTELLAISVTMTAHLGAAERLVEAVRGLPNSTQPKIIVGGYAFKRSEKTWRRLGADGYGHDADDAVRIARTVASAAGAPV